jgi:hypothetical protein
LEWGESACFYIPFTNGFQLMKVAEKLLGINTIEVNFGKVGKHHVAKGNEFLKGDEFSCFTTQLAMDVEELEQQEFVGNNFQPTQLGNQFVYSDDSGQKEGLFAH